MGLKINKNIILSNYSIDEIRNKAKVTLSQLTDLQKEVIPMLQVQKMKLPAKVEEFTSNDNKADLLYYLYLRSIYVFSYEISKMIVDEFADFQDFINQGGGNSISQEEEFIATIDEISHYIIRMKKSLSEDTLFRLYPMKKHLGLVGAHVAGGYTFDDILGEVCYEGITSNLIQYVIGDMVPAEPNIEKLQ